MLRTLLTLSNLRTPHLFHRCDDLSRIGIRNGSMQGKLSRTLRGRCADVRGGSSDRISSEGVRESWAALITTSPWTAPLIEHCLTQTSPGWAVQTTGPSREYRHSSGWGFTTRPLRARDHGNWPVPRRAGSVQSRSAFPSSSGSRAMLTAIRRASSVVSTFACLASTSVSRLDVGDRLSTGVTDDVAAGYCVGSPRCGEAAW
jgi:hypothetical protein